MDKNNFNFLLDTFENDDIKEFAKQCIETIPDYFYQVPASSTGKYHPSYTLGEGGLFKHTCGVVIFLNHLLSLDCWKMKTQSRYRDLVRVACIMHDTRKSGDSEAFAKYKYTRHEHPILAADVIRSIETPFVTKEEKEIVAIGISCHMGQWNTNPKSDVVLPLPLDACSILVHTCDYLASRKDLEVIFPISELLTDNKNVSTVIKTDNEPVLDFGKYKGLTLTQVKTQPGGLEFIKWAKMNIKQEPWKTLLKTV